MNYVSEWKVFVNAFWFALWRLHILKITCGRITVITKEYVSSTIFRKLDCLTIKKFFIK